VPANLTKRDFSKVSGPWRRGVRLALPGLASRSLAAGPASDEFYFVQLSDLHWAQGPRSIRMLKGRCPKAIAAVNALSEQPDFVVFTGDITHTTDDEKNAAHAWRKRRKLSQPEGQAGLFLAGEHDASLDNGAAFKEFFADKLLIRPQGCALYRARQRIGSQGESRTEQLTGSPPTSRSLSGSADRRAYAPAAF